MKGTETSKLTTTQQRDKMSIVTTKQFSQCPQAVHACKWIIGLESIDHNNHLH